MNNKIYSFLGLAKKAGKLVSGGDTCMRAVKSGKVLLIIVAADASDNTKKEFTDACRYRGTDIRFFGEKDLLGKFVGKDLRTVIGILDEGFSSKLKEDIDRLSIENGGGKIG